MSLRVMRMRKRVSLVALIVDRRLVVCHRVSRVLTRSLSVELLEDEEMTERLRVLDDARKLRQLAEAFLYPERPVVTTSETACARNYFHRASSPEGEDAVERALIMEDMKALKMFAVNYAHPELPVVTTDATACGRNYFDRASAPVQESMEEVEERERILQDALSLKNHAVEYLHPEKAVVVTDETACARNYFHRPSAPEDTEERDIILAEMKALKKLAVDYAHPELPVVTTDSSACGRNYFDRASAPEQEIDARERDVVLSDMLALKKRAVEYLHPELPVVTTDETATGRNYFDRASAPEMESLADAQERYSVMQDLQELKKLAIDYAHPELSVFTTDDTACGRLYFHRPSAAEQDEVDLIMEDLKALKKLAIEYLHPELSVVTTDETACARNYFDRASAPEVEVQEERALILEDAAALKKLAMDFAHPELGVVTTDETAYGRNYFGRVSAPEQMSTEEAEEYDRFLADAMNLKRFAGDYAHSELGVVTTDETASARSYFGRASAPEVVSTEESVEKARIMEDMKALKKFAVDYAHPELPVLTTDATACGRNYYVRPSAKGHNFISTTREKSFKIVDDEDDYLDECDLHYGNFDMVRFACCDRVMYVVRITTDSHLDVTLLQDDEMVNDMKYQLHTLLDHSHYAISSGVSERQVVVENKEEEGKLSRSPSSVMLFGGVGFEEASY